MSFFFGFVLKFWIYGYLVFSVPALLCWFHVNFWRRACAFSGRMIFFFKPFLTKSQGSYEELFTKFCYQWLRYLNFSFFGDVWFMGLSLLRQAFLKTSCWWCCVGTIMWYYEGVQKIMSYCGFGFALIMNLISSYFIYERFNYYEKVRWWSGNNYKFCWLSGITSAVIWRKKW